MKIAIAGYGVEGKSNYAYWNTPENSLTIVDERAELDGVPEGAQVVIGQGSFGKLADFDLVVRSAGVSPHKITTNGNIWSATNEFFAKCSVPIIGVTGTKGKGTTCSLITSILRKAGKTVHLVGNIGTPALDILPKIHENDIVVYELSSFQLWDLEKSPHIAVVLMVEPDHLDVHASFEEYVQAKSNIAKFQTSDDVTIYHPTNKYSHQIASSGNGKKKRYGVVDDGVAYIKDDKFFTHDHAICGVDTLHIAGMHNRENACAAISAALTICPKLTDEQISAGLKGFTGLPHRLKFVSETRGVRYYDDSIATTPGSAIAALRAFDQPKIIILGGSDKGADYQEVVDVAKQTNSRVLAIGQTGEKIYQICLEKGVEAERETGYMDEVVKRATTMSNPGDVVILSPASASFDQYKSYTDRGRQFVSAVEMILNC